MKNRRFAVRFLAVLVVLFLAVPAFAAGTYVKDTARIFTGQELTRLEQRAAQISETYQFGVYIRVLEDFQEESGYRDIEKYTMDLYDSEGMGFGEGHAGVILVLSMSERDYDLDFYGDWSDYAFTERGRDRMEERFLSYFGRDDFYGGCSKFLEDCETYLKAALEGSPVAAQSGEEEGLSIAFALIPGAIAAIVVGVLLAAPMHTARQKGDANAYIVSGSLQLHRRSDMFLHRSVTCTPRQTQTSSGSSGSHHYSSGGHSGRSGKF